MDAHAHAHDWTGHSLFLVVVIFLAVYLLLAFFNPEWVQREDKRGDKTGELDVFVAMLWAAGITILILVALALLWYGFSCWY